jgi:hypothetical protein
VPVVPVAPVPVVSPVVPVPLVAPVVPVVPLEPELLLGAVADVSPVPVVLVGSVFLQAARLAISAAANRIFDALLRAFICLLLVHVYRLPPSPGEALEGRRRFGFPMDLQAQARTIGEPTQYAAPVEYESDCQD